MHTQSEVLVPCRFVPPVLSRRPQNIFIFTIIINITIINKSLSSTLKCVILLLPHTLAGIFSRFGIFVGISCPVRFPCYLQHFGAGSCHFTCILQHFGVRTFHFPQYLQHFGSRTVHVAWFLATTIHIGLAQGWFLGWLNFCQVGFSYSRLVLELAQGWFRVCLGLV